MANTSVTIAVVTRNRAWSLGRLLNSLEKQTVYPLEILIVDNASTDNTKEVVGEFKSKLKKIRYVIEKRIGIPYARNRGLKEAKGQILAFIDDDCQASPSWISNIKKFHKQHPRAIALQGYSDSAPKNSLISILTGYNKEIFIKSNIQHPILKKKLSSAWAFKKAIEENRHFPIVTLDTKNASFKMKRIRKLHVGLDNNLHRLGADVDFGKKLLSLGQVIIFCPDIKVTHWERTNLGDFLAQRFEFARGGVMARERWGYRTRTRNILFVMLQALVMYCMAHKIPFYIWPALFVLFFLDKTWTKWGHYFQKGQINRTGIKLLDENTILRAFFWLGSSDVIQKSTHFVIIVGIASFGPVYIGVFHLSIRIFHLLENLLTRIFAIKFIPRLRTALYLEKRTNAAPTPEEIVAYSLKFYALISILVTLVALLVFIPAASYFNLSRFPYFIFLILAFPFAVMSYYILNVLRLLQKFGQALIIQVALTLVAQIGLFILLTKLLSLRLLAVGIAQFIAFVFAFTVGLVLLFPFINPVGFVKNTQQKIYKIKLRTIVNFLSIGIARIIDIILVALIFGISTLGFYTVLLYPALIMYSLSTSSFGMFIHTALLQTQQKREITSLSKKVAKWMLLVTIPVLIILLVFPGELLALAFHQRYLEEIQIVRILVIAHFIQVLSWFVGCMLIIKNRIKIYILSNIVLGIALFVGILSLTQTFGLTGVALGVLVASIIDFLVKTLLFAKHRYLSRAGAKIELETTQAVVS